MTTMVPPNFDPFVDLKRETPAVDNFLSCVTAHADIAQDEGATKAQIVEALRLVIADVESWDIR